MSGADEEVARGIAMHTVAMKPRVLSPDEVDESLLSKEREVWAEQLKNEGKPEQIIDNILKGKEKKFREEAALVKQAFVKNPEQSVEEYAKANGAEVVGFVHVEI